MGWGPIGSIAGNAGLSWLAGQDARHAAENANITNREIASENAALQREFAQHGIRWKVEDAKAAGLSPLAALGASGAAFSPSAVSVMPEPSEFGEMARGMGQDLTRSISATRTAEEKESAALSLQMQKTQLEGAQLDNAVRASQLQKMQMTSPAMAGSDHFIPGQGNSGVQVTSAQRTASQGSRHAQQAGWVPDVGYARTDTGLTPVPSKDVKERIEDQIVPEMMWAARNYLLPNLGMGEPPANPPPKGADGWIWSYSRQEWQPAIKSVNGGGLRPMPKQYWDGSPQPKLRKK